MAGNSLGNNRVLKAMKEIQESTGMGFYAWFDVDTILVFMFNRVNVNAHRNMKISLKRLVKLGFVQKSQVMGRSFYRLSKKGRDKCSEELFLAG